MEDKPRFWGKGWIYFGRCKLWELIKPQCTWSEDKENPYPGAREKNLEVTNTGDHINLESRWHRNLCRIIYEYHLLKKKHKPPFVHNRKQMKIWLWSSLWHFLLPLHTSTLLGSHIKILWTSQVYETPSPSPKFSACLVNTHLALSSKSKVTLPGKPWTTWFPISGGVHSSCLLLSTELAHTSPLDIQVFLLHEAESS